MLGSSLKTYHLTWLLCLYSLFYSVSSLASLSNEGAVAGNFNVSNGVANYIVPIETPPGMAGMEPSVSLAYISNAGNGLVGVGWSIGGISQISRCPMTLAQDGDIDPVDFDDNDQFCLDGVRLVPISGDSCNDGCTAIYRTEIDSFFKIKSYGSVKDPAYFKVHTQSGQTKYYGSSQNSRIEAEGRSQALLWVINHVEDKVGNFLTYSYHEDNSNGYGRIDRIDYTGNAAGGLTPGASVVFEFEQRPDKSIDYLHGSKISLLERLKAIKTYFNDNSTGQQHLVRDYRLSYITSESSNRSLLSRVDECGNDSVCKLASTFDWENDVPGTFTGSTGFMPEQPNINLVFDQQMGLFQGDFNGDGNPDLIRWSNLASENQLFFGNGGGLFWKAGAFNITDTYLAHENGTVGSFIADFNGDGRSDILRWWDTKSKNELFISNGDGSFTPSGNITIKNEYLGHSNGTVGSFIADFTGDGLPDILRWWDSFSRNTIFVNNGNGGFDEIGEFNIKHTYLQHSNKTVGSFIADFNGDGRADILRWWNDYKQNKLFISNGDGTFTEEKDKFNIQNTYLSHSNNTVGSLISDYNGDGNADILRWWETSSYSVLYLSNGDGSFTLSDKFNIKDTPLVHSKNKAGSLIGDFNGDGTPDLIRWSDDVWKNTLYIGRGDGSFAVSSEFSITDTHLSNSDGESGSILGDYDGDGKTDILRWARNQYYNKLFLSGGRYATDKIISFNNPLDSIYKVSYRTLAKNTVYQPTNDADNSQGYQDVAGSMPVVSYYAKSDGKYNNISFSYYYKGLKAHRLGRGSMGFKEVTMINGNTGFESTVTYNQEYPLNGKPVSSVSKFGNVVITDTQNNWIVDNTRHDNQITAINLASTTTTSRELNTNQIVTQSTTSTTYDSYNNAVNIVVDNHDGYQTITKNTFKPADTDEWCTGRLETASVTKITPTGTAPARNSRFEYDTDTCLLVKEIIEPDKPDFYKETTYTYDVFGNKATVTTNGHPSAKHPFVSRTLSSQYVPATIGALNPKVETINDFGHTETKTYDARIGEIVALKGPNGLVTRWEFDSLGRQTKELRADGTYTTIQYSLCSSNCQYNAPFSVTSQAFGNDNSPASPPATVYFDVQGREFLTTTIGFNGEAICNETQFDNLGRVYKKSLPYFADTMQSCGLGNFSNKYRVMYYDPLNRLTKTTFPDNSYVRAEYNGYETTTINDLEQRSVKLINSQKQLVLVTDDAGNSTSYKYDPYGNQIEVTDAANNVTTMVYDLAGNKIEMFDPDMGHWRYEYNALGELVIQTDAKQQTVTIEYDTLGRITKKTTLEGVSNWYYDPPGALGKLDRVAMTGGYSTKETYDALLRPITSTINYDGRSYEVSTSYDNIHGRVTHVDYPDVTGGTPGLSIESVYDDSGFLTEMRDASGQYSYWKLEQVNASGQTEMETYGNGVKNIRQYDEYTGRISDIITSLGTQELQSLHYEFDTLGNLIERIDNLQGSTEISEYDNLSRLKSVSVTNSAFTYQKTYDYDSIGNITFKSDVGSYLYGQGGAGPHQVTTAGSNTYQYDKNGNQVSGNGRTMTYTSFNKPLSITKGSTSSSYTYNSSQNRIKKVTTIGSQETTTFYLGKALERVTKPDGAVEHKYYLGAGNATALVTRRSDGSNSIQYMHTDHIGSVDLVTEGNPQSNGQLNWETGGGSPWSADSAVYNGGSDSMGSGSLGHNQESWLDTQVEGATNVSFYWKVSSEANYDYLRFYVDGVEQTKISGNLDWQQQSFPLSTGKHILTWKYTKDGSVSAGTDRGWLDSVKFDGAITAPVLTGNPSLGQAVDNSSLDWFTGGNTDWMSQTTNSVSGGDAAQSGIVNHNQNSWVETQVIDATSVSFYWMVSSESNYDYLRFFIDGLEQTRVSGEQGWQQLTYPLSPGSHTLRWSYTKDGSVSTGQDRGWLDLVTFQGSATPASDSGDSSPIHATLTDHATTSGSIVKERNSFDAWGARRLDTWQVPGPGQTPVSITTRGFTNHEMEDEIALINMNARLYDPVLGRFLQADTIVQFPDSTQGFNRYTYVNNNPLSFTDPSGHSIATYFLHPYVIFFGAENVENFFIKYEWARQLGSIAVANFTGPYGAALFQSYLVHIQGGSTQDVIRAAAISLVTSTMYGGIGQGIDPTSSAGSAVGAVFAHGMVGGASAGMQGGDFEKGFLAGAVGKMATIGGKYAGLGDIGNGIVTITAAGISAELGGGKFADGAMTAAMGYILNSLAHEKQPGVALSEEGEVLHHNGDSGVVTNVLNANMADMYSKCNTLVGSCEGSYNILPPLTKEQARSDNVATQNISDGLFLGSRGLAKRNPAAGAAMGIFRGIYNGARHTHVEGDVRIIMFMKKIYNFGSQKIYGRGEMRVITVRQ